MGQSRGSGFGKAGSSLPVQVSSAGLVVATHDVTWLLHPFQELPWQCHHLCDGWGASESRAFFRFFLPFFLPCSSPALLHSLIIMDGVLP